MQEVNPHATDSRAMVAADRAPERLSSIKAAE
jgi:hypothetical protein